MNLKKNIYTVIQGSTNSSFWVFSSNHFVLMSILFLGIACEKKKPLDYSTEIKPILNKNCITCHGGVKKNGGFSLLFQEEAFANTESGIPAIIPGDAASSPFIQRLHETDPELRMPYEKSKLSNEKIDLLTRWINEGANWGKHWAYTIPKEVSVPRLSEKAGFGETEGSSFIRNGIDYFVLEKLQAHKILPSEPAGNSIIARRIAMDITGLPPDMKLYNGFNEGKISLEEFIDRLMAHESYGEKWASWWLDHARYADTKGYEKDLGRPMWKYRDWVIKAFNKDMPFDQFTMEQLAGDLLPNPSVDQLIATAFHRNTMNNDEGGTEDEEFRVASVMDRVNTTFEVWQSTTIGCVQCHSHTYDPFKHEEYYKLMAFFDNTRDEDTYANEPNLKFYSEKQSNEINSILKGISAKYNPETSKKYKDFISFNEPVYHAHSCQNYKNASLLDTKWLSLRNNGSCNLNDVYTQGANYIYIKHSSQNNGTQITMRKDNAQGEIVAKFPIDKTKGTVVQRFPFKKINDKIDLFIAAENGTIPSNSGTGLITWFAFLPDVTSDKTGVSTVMHDKILELINAETPLLPIMVENPDYMERTTQVFERGNWLMKGDTVQPGTPQILNEWKEEWPRNRLGLSNWLVSKENPLTARTLVNRVWYEIFGRGLVESLEDLGSQSDPPTHPALLDWLALRFMNEHNWSIKALVKEILMSGTYAQNSALSPELYDLDPKNKFYARGPRFRLSAEQIRDQALFVSGLLSKKMYGPSVMPPQPEGIWQTVYNGGNWVTSEGEDRYRRAVYTFLKRTSPYPSFITFDAGSREVSEVKRTVTNTPLQALVTLNDPVYHEAAYHLAKKMSVEKNTEEGISKGYKMAMLGDIDSVKLKTLKELYNEAFLDFNKNPNNIKMFLPLEINPTADLAALTVVANSIMNLDEFLTKS